MKISYVSLISSLKSFIEIAAAEQLQHLDVSSRGLNPQCSGQTVKN